MGVWPAAWWCVERTQYVCVSKLCNVDAHAPGVIMSFCL